ncbi:hypothetical protein [Mucilaginibacter boryungensis]|uniref:CHRD domain-containing protein n=1 Tax=Mucilaginibacter boryungensis TaxID=768480 RepID=A0ABR9XF31_9SPHI|nr:hypothetical protein [Mucilaginibacter boryungensis]MBE9665782.1 hypothetical protein [Mucilaginibacter boryungensis]
MKKYISAALTGLLAITMFSCTKKADVVGIEAKLPPVQLSSIGLITPAPFSTTSVIQLTFGATLTKLTPGAFDLEIYDNTTSTQTLVQTIHFNSWSGFDSTTPATTPATTPVGTAGKISYTNPDTTYPNTIVYNGTILIKLNKLTSGKIYTLKGYARTSDGQVSTFTISKLFTVS